jgi:hypothetical protein
VTEQPQERPDEGPQPLPRTGVAAADSAAQSLVELDEAPLDQHVEIYEDAHRRLQGGLADLDEQ